MLSINHHDYAAANVNGLLPMTLSPLPTSNCPDLHMLTWEGTGLSIFMESDRLRELAALILDKFPLIAPRPEQVQPDPRCEECGGVIGVGGVEDTCADCVEVV